MIAARQQLIGILVLGLALGGSSASFAKDAKSKGRSPAQVRTKPAPLAAPHLQHPVPAQPEWVVAAEVASKTPVEPQPRPVLRRPEFIQAAGNTAPLNQRDHGYFRDNFWVKK